MTDAKTPTKRKPARQVLSEGEKAAMRETVRERRVQASSKDPRGDGERDLLAKIAEMPPADRQIAERLHARITAAAPDLWSRTWYGMPAWTRDGKIVCFFKAASKFNSRYATFGFEEAARLDDGQMWPTSYAITTLTTADEDRLVELVKKAAS